MASKNDAKYIKFIVYVVVVVLINLVGLTLFFRIDLTEKKLYSISKASQEMVATLSDPLTINVFFTKDLPAPHNNTERYLRDLLEEYAVYANKYFNYRFYNVSPETAGEKKDTIDNRDLASTYGINPVQIQAVEDDEVKFKKAYMGLVIIHGDMIERIPVISSIDGLEYKLTTAIQKLHNKTSAMLGLKEKIKIDLYYSSSLNKIASIIGLDNLPQLSKEVEKVVNTLNNKNFDKFDYTFIDPSKNTQAADQAEAFNVKNLKWRDIPQNNIQADNGFIGLVLSYGKKSKTIQLLREVHFLLGGTQYKLVNLDKLDEIIEDNIDSLIDVNEKLGYLADYNTLKTSSPPSTNFMQQPDVETISNFSATISKNYTLKDVTLKDGETSSGLKCLIIARPTEKFSDYDLYQIDQLLMRGTNLAFFMDAFKEVQLQKQKMQFNQGPTFVPIDTGLEKLLSHYGVEISKSYVMDEKCFKRVIQRGAGEQPFYYAPVIQNENIATDLNFMNNIKSLVTMKIAPLELNEKQIMENKITAHKLFSSSENAWEMKGRIQLDPRFIRPPATDADKHSMPLAYLLEGEFSSYFAGKDIPAKPGKADEPQKDEGDKNKKDQAETKNENNTKTDPLLANIEGQSGFIAKSPPSKIFIVGSAEMLKNNMFLQEGQQGSNDTNIRNNHNFILNVIDELNDRSDIAEMRSKEQHFNPLNEKRKATLKNPVKIFNIAGLPLLTALFGLAIWFLRRSKRKRIEMMFSK